jgi:hypothetical protein
MARNADRDNLTLLAGPHALAVIRDGGLRPSSVTTVTGAAGGPKWLVLVGLDRAVFFSWLSGRSAPVELVGASIGAWRFAAVAQGGRAAEAHEALRAAYTAQTYDGRPSAREVTEEAIRIQDVYLPGEGIEQITRNPSFRLTVITAGGKGPFASGGRRRAAAGMVLAGAANAARRGNLGRFFVRTVFTDTRNGELPPAARAFLDDTIDTVCVPLTKRNVKQAILASGSIPVVMEGIRDIPGAPPGVYWDGGLVDYHVTVPRPPTAEPDGIVLFPHYTDRIIPGWLDKYVPWRGPAPSALDRTLLVAPSREFVARLPYGKIPDRTDFKRFFGNDRERIAYWERTTAEGMRLADEFLELVGSGRIGRRVRPFPTPGTGIQRD